MNIQDVSGILKQGLKDNYDSQVSIQVKNALMEDERLEFFREGDVIHNHKFHYSTGNWLAVKGMYANAVELKHKNGWYTWQDTDEVNWDALD